MLQQTQVAAVIPYYNEWLRRFPDFAVLAAAPENDVLHAWQGLGYYARARNLHATTKTVQDRHGGSFPVDLEAIRQLPGIGRYTANAILAFALDQSVPVVDANIARVIARLFAMRQPIDAAAGREMLWHYAFNLLPKKQAAAHNSALMDLGALLCTAHAPKCGICPVKKFCRAKNPENLPIKRARSGIEKLTESHTFVVRRKKVLLEKSRKRWPGMWILPPLKTRSTIKRPFYMSIFPFTNHRITLKVFPQSLLRIDNQRQRWFSPCELESIPIPSPHRRAIVDLLRAARLTPLHRQRS